MQSGQSKSGRRGLREIAAEANVSMATVSRVLTGNASVKPEIQQAVLQAVKKLNIDLPERNKDKSLVFVLGNRPFAHAFHSPVLLGAEAYCAEHGWDLFFLFFNYSPRIPWKELHLPKVVQRRDLVRGVVLAGTHSANLLDLLAHKGIPCVVLGNNVIGEPREAGRDMVFSDDIQGSQDITRHLIQLGHRDIWFVGNTRLPWFARCFEGYTRAMLEAGLPVREQNIDSEDDTAIGYLGAKSIIGSGAPATAIFAGNDSTAHGVYRTLREYQLDVPGDISVVGCNDTLGALLYPGLTTIREFPEQLGRRMVELILDRIGNPATEPRRVTIPTEFIKRDSAGPIAASSAHVPSGAAADAVSPALTE